MLKSFSILAVASFLSGAMAFAGPCDRSLTAASMNGQERADMARNGIAQRDVKVGDYFVSYIFAEANFDAELAMGVYTSCDEHKTTSDHPDLGLGSFILKSDVVGSKNANPFRVSYTQAGSWGFSGGSYTVENTVRKDGASYLMTTSLVGPDDDASFSPKAADGFVRMTSEGPNKVFVVACNYMLPQSPPPFSGGTYNKMARQRLHDSGVNLTKWVTAVSQGQGLHSADEYRQHLKALLGQ